MQEEAILVLTYEAMIYEHKNKMVNTGKQMVITEKNLSWLLELQGDEKALNSVLLEDIILATRVLKMGLTFQ